VGLVNDDQVGAVVEELVAPVGGLDEVGGHDDERVPVEERLVHHQAAFETSHRRGQDELGVDAELLA